MTSVYRAIKRMGYNGLDVQYSLEVKAVMDRMLATVWDSYHARPVQTVSHVCYNSRSWYDPERV